MAPDEISFVAHPPERARRSTALLSAGCCCCCCCCFHSLGSLAGALHGMRGGHTPPTPGLSPSESEREQVERKVADKYAVKIYWLALLIVAIITTLVTIGENRNDNPLEALGIAGLIIAGFLPAGQLAASVLALIYINVFPPVRKPQALRRLGRITLFTFIWGLIGSALTAIVLAGFN